MASAAPPKFIINWHNEEMARRVALDEPVDWPFIFCNSHPVDLEIGIGNGSFLVPFLSDRADRNMVGIELEPDYVRRADRRLVRAGLNNGRLLVGDAKLLVWRLFRPQSISDVYINYPDPWFKKRHIKRRLVNSSFLRMLATRMNGTLTIATDDREYRDFVLSSVSAADCFAPEFEDLFVNSLPGYYETKYESKWKSMGKISYYMKFRKRAAPVMDMEAYMQSQHLQFVLGKIMERSSSENQRSKG